MFPSYQSDSDIQKIIAKLAPAVINKHQVQFWYEDETDKKRKDWRIINPHIIGTNINSKEYQLSGYFIPTPLQIADKYKAGWRNYKIERLDILKIKILKTKYPYTVKNYDPKAKHSMSEVICATVPNPDPLD